MAFEASDAPIDDLAGFFSDLVRCETRMYNALNDRLRERHGIVTSQFESLRYLREHPGTRVAEMAAQFAIGIGSTSKVVDRLEARGWVERRPNPADRRSSLLALTEDGRRLVEAAEATFSERLAELIAHSPGGPSITQAAQAFAQLRSALERDEIGTPTG